MAHELVIRVGEYAILPEGHPAGEYDLNRGFPPWFNQLPCLFQLQDLKDYIDGSIDIIHTTLEHLIALRDLVLHFDWFLSPLVSLRYPLRQLWLVGRGLWLLEDRLKTIQGHLNCFVEAANQ